MEKSSFFNDVDNDRVYFAEDFARHLAQYFTNGIFNNGCQVLGDNNDMSVNVSIGAAQINGYRYDNDAIKTLQIDNADGVLDRIDNIVIRLDLINRNITIQVIKGNFAENPIAPELVRNSTIYDLRIAKINIFSGTTTITQDLIEDTRFLNNDCGNVISTVETPDTEELYSQLYAKANKLINDSQKKFVAWFSGLQDLIDENIATKLVNKIIDSSLKSFETTLLAENWVLNEETYYYEYNIEKEDITSKTLVEFFVDIVNQEKITGRMYTLSYDRGFKFIANELPIENIELNVVYQLTNIEMESE